MITAATTSIQRFGSLCAAALVATGGAPFERYSVVRYAAMRDVCWMSAGSSVREDDAGRRTLLSVKQLQILPCVLSAMLPDGSAYVNGLHHNTQKHLTL